MILMLFLMWKVHKMLTFGATVKELNLFNENYQKLYICLPSNF